MSSQVNPIDQSQVPAVKECFACKAVAVFTIKRNDRTLMACNKPSCIKIVDDMVVSLCAMDSRGF